MINHSDRTASFPSLADHLRAIELARLQALVTRDMALAWQLHAADFELVTPSGATCTRERYLNRVAEGGFYLRWAAGEMAVRVHGGCAAVIRYPAALQLGSEQVPGTTLRCWHLDSYELNDGLWQVVWSQATQIRG